VSVAVVNLSIDKKPVSECLSEPSPALFTRLISKYTGKVTKARSARAGSHHNRTIEFEGLMSNLGGLVVFK
jgi:hypothetical protein